MNLDFMEAKLLPPIIPVFQHSIVPGSRFPIFHHYSIPFCVGGRMRGFFDKLKKGLSKTHQGFVEKIDHLFLGKKTIDQELLDELESVLFAADLGVKTSTQLIEGVQQALKRGELKDPEKVKEFIK